MNYTSYTIVGLGEIAWDLLPQGRQLGGAPSNVAYICHLLGSPALIASRVGTDELGKEALTRVSSLGLSTRYIQLDDKHQTGVVNVRIDEHGDATFSSNDDPAWDHLEWTPEWEDIAKRADGVSFGTPAQRRPQSRSTIQRFLRSTRAGTLHVFDVNLRPSFVTPEILCESLQAATVVKLNHKELPAVARLLGLSAIDERDFALDLIEQFDLSLVAITRGAQGSVLVTANKTVEHPGFRVRVKDTIGAGDAFTAVLLLSLLHHVPLEKISDTANQVGAWIVTQVGATPLVDSQSIAGVLNEIAAEVAGTEDI